MTGSFGLAVLLSNSGAHITILKERPAFHLHPSTGTSLDTLFAAFGYLARAAAWLHEWEAPRQGVRVSIESVVVDRLQEPDVLRRPAIVMVSRGSHASDPDFPGGVLHWIVVTDVEDDGARFHGPDIESE
ncbi:MAG: hypothetical protein WA688_00655 [Thermoplasmata archaeon]